jgi:integrase
MIVVRLRGIKKARAKGRVYFYHRGTGTRLPDDPHSAAFIEAVARLESASRTASAGKAGTLGALIAAYRTSPECARLADRTRHDYELVFNYLKPPDGMPLLQLDSAAVIGIRDRAFAQKKRRFANHVLQVLGTILNWGRPRKLAPATNPAIGIPKLPRPRDLPPANRDWSDEETDAVLGAADGGLKVAISLAVYAGMRGGDIVRVTWAAYDGTVLEWKQGKTGAEVWLPCLPELKWILDAAPRTATTNRHAAKRHAYDRSRPPQSVPNAHFAADARGSGRPGINPAWPPPHTRQSPHGSRSRSAHGAGRSRP